MKHLLPVLFAVLLADPMVAQHLRVVDSLSRLLARAKTDQAKAPLLSELAYQYTFNRADSAIHYANWGLRLAKKPESGIHEGAYLNVLGVVENHRGNYTKALDYHFKALEEAKALGNEVDQARSYNNIATIYSTQGNHHKSLGYYQDARQLYEKHNNPNQHILTLNIGIIYQFLHQYDKAQFHYFKSLAGNRRAKVKRGEGMALYNLGYSHQVAQRYDSALWYYGQAAILFKELGQNQTLSKTYQNSGSILVKQGKFAEAQQRFDESFALTQVTQDRRTRALLLADMASLQIALKNLDKAEQLATQALALAQEINNQIEIKRTALILSELYEAKQDFRQALQYYRVAQVAKDSVDNIERQKAIITMQGDYEMQAQKATIALQESEAQRQAQQIALLERDVLLRQADMIQQEFMLSEGRALKRLDSLNLKRELDNQTNRAMLQESELLRQKADLAKNQVELAQRNLQRNTLTAGVLLLLLLMGTLVVFLRQKQRSNRLLKAQKEDLAKLNHTKDKLFSIVAHDLRSPFQGLKWTLELLEQHNISQQDFVSLTTQLRENVETLSDNLNNLLLWASSQMKGIRPKPGNLVVGDEANAVLSLYSGPAAGKKLQLKAQIPDNIHIWADRDHLRLVLRNLVNNAIKFTHEGGSVQVNCQALPKFVRVSVSDTGVGMDQDQVNNLFQLGSQATKPGTANEKGVGLGLLLCQEFLSANGGRIWAESHPGKGSVFTFELPVA
jgi:signal transduction histidine kinase